MVIRPLAPEKVLRFAIFLVMLSLITLGTGEEVIAQQQKLRSCEQSFIESPLAGDALLTSEAERRAVADATFTLRFERTKLDTEAEGIAQVAVNGQTLYVRMCAVDLPLPSRWKEARYSLWVYLPNYEQKIYIGDLPLIPTPNRNRRREESRIRRGSSDSFYRFSALPRGAVFGGLILTAEPPRYTPIPNEPLRPLLIALIKIGANSTLLY